MSVRLGLRHARVMRALCASCAQGVCQRGVIAAVWSSMGCAWFSFHFPCQCCFFEPWLFFRRPQGLVARAAAGALSAVTGKTGTESKDVKAAIAKYMELVVSELKNNGAFQIGGCLNLKVK